MVCLYKKVINAYLVVNSIMAKDCLFHMIPRDLQRWPSLLKSDKANQTNLKIRRRISYFFSGRFLSYYIGLDCIFQLCSNTNII